MAVIEVQELTKHYGSVTAVDRLSFDVDAGTVVGFLGPNGAGKTTTLRILLGLVHASRGTARIVSSISGVPSICTAKSQCAASGT